MILLNKKEYNSLRECTGDSVIKYSLTGVYFDKVDDKYYNIVALDGRRMLCIKKEHSFTDDYINGKIFTLPKLTLKKNDNVTIKVENEKVIINDVISTEIRGKFANYNLFIRKEKSNFNVRINSNNLLKEYPIMEHGFINNNAAIQCKIKDDNSITEEHITFVYMPLKAEAEETPPDNTPGAPADPEEVTRLQEEIKSLKEKIRTLERNELYNLRRIFA